MTMEMPRNLMLTTGAVTHPHLKQVLKQQHYAGCQLPVVAKNHQDTPNTVTQEQQIQGVGRQQQSSHQTSA
jgi:hypothetical protein